jgi:hypothetical protein
MLARPNSMLPHSSMNASGAASANSTAVAPVRRDEVFRAEGKRNIIIS